ncbi:hypothetical protein [Paenibacillus thalictri]|uniref:Uncharacterized protein n=1 Tax=Paenibacillus thalictri TaxID=2527873 RepID=A0A4Q9DP45_9BACL|nr:hypothetical protein [Paenibacillus thalictri]TBL77841.1 hypothetical protein EYB31_17030 [Paenibacillus thalictri]
MAYNRKLMTDQDFQEALERQTKIRVFQDDHVVDSGGAIIRFDDEVVVIQSGVSEISYLKRLHCEFFAAHFPGKRKI